MTILIVDDLEDNREALERLIGRYSRKYGHECEILHASNGQEAVEMSVMHNIDLIFMDMVMPIMDGLEATRTIKNLGSTAMIVVVSSEDDNKLKYQMLNAGAEDYIVKPFSSDLMISRMNNYQKIIASRQGISFQSKAVNTFTNEVFSYNSCFRITNEEELAQLWETLLVRWEYQKQIKDLSDFVRFLFYLGDYQLQKSYKCHIFIEEDKDNFYFSVDNMNLLSHKVIENSIAKYNEKNEYKLKGDMISFKLPRILTTQEHSLNEETGVASVEKTKESVDTVVKKSEPLTAAAPLKKGPKEKIVLQTFKILDDESLSEFESSVNKLKMEISMMGSSSLEMEDIDTMNEYIKQMCNVLSVSQDSYHISESLRSFSQLLDDYSDEFLNKSSELAQLVTSFVNDILTWKEMIFYTGAPSVDFLNQSISSNIEMIRAVFIEVETNEDDLDDIFDF